MLSRTPVEPSVSSLTSKPCFATNLPRSLISSPRMSIGMNYRNLPRSFLDLNPWSAFPRRYLPQSAHILSTHPNFQSPPIIVQRLTKREHILTPQADIPRNNLQVLRPPQLGTKRTAPLHDLFPKLLIPLVAPIVVVPAAAEDDAALEWAREDIGGRRVDAFGRANVPRNYTC